MSRADRIERLDDYVTRTLDENAAATFEDEMFEAVGNDADAESDTRFFDRAERIITTFAAHGGLSGPSTAKTVEALRAAGVNIHVVDVPGEGGRLELAPWPEDAEVIIIRNHIDVRGYSEVEVEVENPNGTPVKTFRGVECDPETGNIYAVCAAPLARMAYGVARRISRITGVRDGKREVISVFDTSPQT